MNNQNVETRSDAAISWAVTIGIAAALALSPLAWWPQDPYGLIKNVVVELAVFSLASLCLCSALARGKLRYTHSPVTLPVVLFLAGAVLSHALSRFGGYGGPRLREIFACVLLYLLAFNRVGGDRRKYVVYMGAFAGLAASALIGIGQHVQLIPTSWEASPWGGGLGSRVYGLMLNPNILAGHIIAVFPLGAAMFLLLWRGTARFWSGLALAAAFACLLLTVSWGGFAGFAAAALFIGAALASQGRRKMVVPAAGPLALTLACICAAVFFFAARGKSTVSDTSGMQARYLIWKASSEAVRERPVLGHGPGNTASALGEHLTAAVMEHYRDNPESPPWRGSYRIRFLDGDYFGEAVEFGFAGLAILAWFFIALFRQVTRVIRSGPGRLSLCGAIGLGAAAAAILVQSSVSYPLRVPPTAAFFFVLLGIVASESRGKSVTIGIVETLPPVRVSLTVIAAIFFTIVSVLSVATLHGELLLVRAFNFASRGFWPQAAKQAGEATRYPIVDPEAFNIRGDAMLQLSLPDEAEASFTALIRYDPSRPDAYRKLGTISEFGGINEAALRYYRKAVELERHDTPQLRVHLARLLERTGRRDEAEEVIREGTLIYPNDTLLRREWDRVRAAPRTGQAPPD